MADQLDATTVLRAFNGRGVRYVVIGAFAAIVAGAPLAATFDIDLTPEASRENLDRLSLALTNLGARIRAEGVPEGLPFAHDGASHGAASIWNLVCGAGAFDIAFWPSGFERGYEDLAAHAREVVVDDVPTRIADLADVIASKRAAGREKDKSRCLRWSSRKASSTGSTTMFAMRLPAGRKSAFPSVVVDVHQRQTPAQAVVRG